MFMEPITGLEKVSKQRWKLVSALTTSFVLVVEATVEMLDMRDPRGGLYTV